MKRSQSETIGSVEIDLIFLIVSPRFLKNLRQNGVPFRA
ncbi:hypothetical protein LEP1GSC103_1185 [Leptospira borgpetersenii serovar Javanica str. UI 09931]|uniref:Uncharacterized protein n=5 Tax=Leptospira borgpetersenii TaxID=174 RepID=M3GLL5_LEPBO|nr:hypothetical protein LBBP_02737 [Leptospira borgpetersenii serovar Ballum]EKP15145.1 hypothetical protein LEP1GSC128_2246 [Leptospira borgpetersenii str. 200801926]EKQ90128.1 hypothetical protein LEP1GSC101_2074 [Leptospira borgpetersenii str. UI 09149]EKQ99375.1 hypothetical protein LEP1GSC121_2685 [Leptospira borgpetersenii serovar Castellonis str. 200801910]EMG01877.1 hypothetical protein LEP1GSC123_0335 [Leptospira borgpetersenii str. 200701203]EMO10825.1 hypothetical protein LEP1GSC137